ncbi:verprolin [Pyricularia oryzae 70-15]|uniref:Verprolin n=3 Tax=Pyricularia oryzae TaxID=318829 RepID=G4MPG0_PYRO7|nr:verprolin [Pyricularia oryzae 70-15]EHA58003.1 verprolin [Pyricularia oryzae 70-15]ELQ37865.1 verprolin [Pyricularia oryzae Y34]KAI7915477.1 verprolin [Pyricularia oryzae]KAI7928139.1 verprolin [Pyricularia oryzae]
MMLSSSTYQQPPSPSHGRRGGRHLNTIMEEEHEETSPIVRQKRSVHNQNISGNRGQNMKIQAWLGPIGDHFPTPRGVNFMVAPNLPSSPSSASAEESSTPTSSSSHSYDDVFNRRDSAMTDATVFDDLYDVSDEEIERQGSLRSTESLVRRKSSRRKSITRPSSANSTRKSLPKLVIPGSQPFAKPEQPKMRKASPINPTPTSILQMSPAIISYMQAQQAVAIPTISAPPSLDGSSLDGSLTSDQMAQLSAPPTPVIGGQDEPNNDWSGVHLQPGALATLASISGNSSDAGELHGEPDQPIEVPESPQEMSEMRQLQQSSRFLINLRRASAPQSPAGASLAGLTRLDIPSPGGFFSDLSPRSRHTWTWPVAQEPEEAAPPTSTTAEQFYKAPWNTDRTPPARALHMAAGDFSDSPVEQVVEMPFKGPVEDDLPTAVRIQQTPVTAVRITESGTDTSVTLNNEETAYSPVKEVLEQFYPKEEEPGLSQVDRTERWLMAQRAYLKPIDSIPEVDGEEQEEQISDDKSDAEEIKPAVPRKDTIYIKKIKAVAAAKQDEAKDEDTAPQKKTVRFSEFVKSSAIPKSLPSKLARQESAYYRAFTDYTVRAQQKDAFISRMPRFEALQAQRVSLSESHRNQLLGKYQLSVVPLSAKKRMSTNVVRGDDVVTVDPEKLRADMESEAMAQSSTAVWNVAATKMLNGGRLIAAPVHKRLARLSRMQGTNGADRARILDLGGQTTCDWAWHAALQYPNTKIYTVTTKSARQLSNCNVRGPPNHRQVAVERLTRLPFANDHFDLISARELHSMLRRDGENGEDEWESCLRECMRVLKPGGFLEFSIMDAEIVNAGPLGNAKAVEFSFALKRLGYDPNPSQMFLGRLSRAGFKDARRAWTCMPMGPKPAAAVPVARDSAGFPVPTLQMEAFVSGSSDDVAAVTGIAASWSWERWLLRAEVESASGDLRLCDIVDGPGVTGKSLEGVHAVIEEGRQAGSCWRVLRGYARKPRPDLGFINMCLGSPVKQ